MSASNSPKYRKAWSERVSASSDAIAVKRSFQRPPYAAVRACLRSRGYRVEDPGLIARWMQHKLGDWVPAVCFRGSERCTRWVRSEIGKPMEYSDGSVVPNANKLGLALSMRRYLTREPAEVA